MELGWGGADQAADLVQGLDAGLDARRPRGTFEYRMGLKVVQRVPWSWAHTSSAHEERPPARRIQPFGLAVPGPMPGKTGRSPLGTVSESAHAEDVTQTSNLHDEVIKTADAAELRRTPDINDTRTGVAVDHEAVTLSDEVELQDGRIDAGFVKDAVQRVEKITVGDPLDTDSEMGPQNNADQLEKISSYLKFGSEEGAKVLIGGDRAEMTGDPKGGSFVQPTVFQGTNDMRLFRQEIFGPVVTVVSFSDYAESIAIAYDTIYGLGSGVWTRDADTAYKASQSIQAGRLWVST